MKADNNEIETGIEFIFKAGKLLELPQKTVAIGCVYFHKFFKSNSINDFDVYLIGSTSLFLAGKISENLRRLRDILNVYRKIIFPNKLPLHITEDKYFDLKDSLSELEAKLLRCLNFNLEIDLPYQYFFNYAHFLRINEGLTQLGYDIINDSFRGSICLEYEPHEISCAAIYLASKLLKQEIKTPSKDFFWYEIFGTRKERLEKLANEISRIIE
eukprot:gene3170-5486_t